jgi:hypothetical protein
MEVPLMKSMMIITMVLFLLSFATVGLALDNSGLVLYLPFNEGSGSTANDKSPMGNNGTINGADWENQGKIGSCLSFQSGDYVDVPHSASLSITDEITIMAWINMAIDSSGEMAIVSKGTWAANDLPYELTVTPGDVIFWQFYDDAGRDTCSPSSPPVNEWHHIAATYDGAIFKCYIDGALGEEWAYAGTMPENIASVTIGKRSKAAGTYFTGLIDEVVIFNRAISVDEVNEAMEGISTAVEPESKMAATWGSIKGVY